MSLESLGRMMHHHTTSGSVVSTFQDMQDFGGFFSEIELNIVLNRQYNRYIHYTHSQYFFIFVLRTRLTDLLICFYDIYIYQAQMKYRNIFIFGQITFCKKKKKKVAYKLRNNNLSLSYMIAKKIGDSSPYPLPVFLRSCFNSFENRIPNFTANGQCLEVYDSM